MAAIPTIESFGVRDPIQQSRLSAIKVRENPGGRHMRRPMRAAAPWHVNGWSLQSRPKGIDAA
jgi:hypothetical protein